MRNEAGWARYWVCGTMSKLESDKYKVSNSLKGILNRASSIAPRTSILGVN